MNDNRMIRIMVFEPGRAPYTTMLEDSLEHRQELVGGDIECIPLPCETVLCCNASGKLTGLPENRQYGPDILHGTFFLYCDTPEGRGVSLTDEQIAMYQEYFPQPVPAAVSFEVRSAADMKEFMNLMFGKGWDMDTGADALTVRRIFWMMMLSGMTWQVSRETARSVQRWKPISMAKVKRCEPVRKIWLISAAVLTNCERPASLTGLAPTAFPFPWIPFLSTLPRNRRNGRTKMIWNYKTRLC